MRRIKGLLGVALIFLCGAICGGVVASGAISHRVQTLASGNPDRIVDMVAKRLRDELKLDEAQRTQLQGILVETRNDLTLIRQKTQPEIAAALVAAEQKVRVVLKPEQLPKFNDIIRKGRERWKVDEKSSLESPKQSL